MYQCIIYCRYILEEYCIVRRDVLVGDFINALTRGGPSGKPAPIETRSHDPQIYITDMLVWLNKAIPIEKHNMDMLVSRCKQTEGNYVFVVLISDVYILSIHLEIFNTHY